MALLTLIELKALRGADHGRRLPDGESMFGTVQANAKGLRVDFQWRYRLAGKARDVRLGSWPSLTLAELRRKRDAMQAQLRAGEDPIDARRA